MNDWTGPTKDYPAENKRLREALMQIIPCLDIALKALQDGPVEKAIDTHTCSYPDGKCHCYDLTCGDCGYSGNDQQISMHNCPTTKHKEPAEGNKERFFELLDKAITPAEAKEESGERHPVDVLLQQPTNLKRIDKDALEAKIRELDHSIKSKNMPFEEFSTYVAVKGALQELLNCLED